MNRLICFLRGHDWRYVKECFLPRHENEREGRQCIRCLRIEWTGTVHNGSKGPTPE